MATKELSSPPRMATLYPKALAGPALRLLPIGGPKRDLPDTQLKLAATEIDGGHLERYREVCGFASSDALPVTYPHMLAFPLAMQLMTDRSFPFPAMGLVHIENRIEQLRPIAADERLGMRVRAADLAEHDKGTQFQIVAEASAGGENVWRSRSTYLHREKRPGGGKSDGDSPRSSPPQPRDYWDIPDDIGRRYAGVSGDRNPIHLHPLTARLFGFPRPIAHGMWLKARCLAEIDQELPDAFSVEVRFKLPLLLPSRVAFADWREGQGRGFAVHAAASGKPHISGSVSARS